MSFLEHNQESIEVPLNLPVNDPLPLEDTPVTEHEVSRLWMGNLDAKISEYQLIKIMQKYGTVKKFDFLFHKSGPLDGQPRGYCFVTYSSREEAERAMKSLDGRIALSKKLSVKWAHSESLTHEIKPKSTSGPSILPATTDHSLQSKIRAIEAKLKLMEQNPDVDQALTLPNSIVSQANKKERTRKKPYKKFNIIKR